MHLLNTLQTMKIVEQAENIYLTTGTTEITDIPPPPPSYLALASYVSCLTLWSNRYFQNRADVLINLPQLDFIVN